MSALLARARQQGSKDLVGFWVGDTYYAIDIHRVREVIRPLPTTALPDMPQVVIGVAEFRRSVIPVIDLRRRFGTTSPVASPKVRWIIVADKGRPVALSVDAVTEVFGYQATMARQVPDFLSSTQRKAVVSACHYQDRLVFILSIDDLVDVAADLDLSVVEAPPGSHEKRGQP